MHVKTTGGTTNVLENEVNFIHYIKILSVNRRQVIIPGPVKITNITPQRLSKGCDIAR